jgi:RNase P subunit RPR2
MKTKLPKKYQSAICQVCQTRADDPDNEVNLINEPEQEYLIECKCGGRYFIMDIGGQIA